MAIDHVACLVYLLQSIFRISQSLGLTELTKQSIRLPDTTSQYTGLPENSSQSVGLSEIFLYFPHTLTEMKNTFKPNFPEQELIRKTVKTVLFDSHVNTKEVVLTHLVISNFLLKSVEYLQTKLRNPYRFDM